MQGKGGADLRAEIPEDEVVVGASRDQLVAPLGQVCAQSSSIGADLQASLNIVNRCSATLCESHTAPTSRHLVETFVQNTETALPLHFFLKEKHYRVCTAITHTQR